MTSLVGEGYRLLVGLWGSLTSCFCHDQNHSHGEKFMRTQEETSVTLLFAAYSLRCHLFFHPFILLKPLWAVLLPDEEACEKRNNNIWVAHRQGRSIVLYLVQALTDPFHTPTIFRFGESTPAVSKIHGDNVRNTAEYKRSLRKLKQTPVTNFEVRQDTPIVLEMHDLRSVRPEFNRKQAEFHALHCSCGRELPIIL